MSSTKNATIHRISGMNGAAFFCFGAGRGGVGDIFFGAGQGSKFTGRGKQYVNAEVNVLF